MRYFTSSTFWASCPPTKLLCHNRVAWRLHLPTHDHYHFQSIRFLRYNFLLLISNVNLSPTENQPLTRRTKMIPLRSCLRVMAHSPSRRWIMANSVALPFCITNLILPYDYVEYSSVVSVVKCWFYFWLWLSRMDKVVVLRKDIICVWLRGTIVNHFMLHSRSMTCFSWIRRIDM